MLSRLKEYKEFIAILVFFLGGFFWIDKEFPKKTDLESQVSAVEASVTSEVRVLKCLLEQYMLVTQLQMRARETEREVRGLTDDLIDRQTAAGEVQPVNLTPAMRMELETLRDTLSRKREELAETNSRIKEIRNELERQSCGSVS